MTTETRTIKVFWITGSNGSILQVQENGDLIVDLDSVSDPTDDAINEWMDANNGKLGIDWQDKPLESDCTLAEIEEYVGAIT